MVGECAAVGATLNTAAQVYALQTECLRWLAGACRIGYIKLTVRGKHRAQVSIVHSSVCVCVCAFVCVCTGVCAKVDTCM